MFFFSIKTFLASKAAFYSEKKLSSVNYQHIFNEKLNWLGDWRQKDRRVEGKKEDPRDISEKGQIN